MFSFFEKWSRNRDADSGLRHDVAALSDRLESGLAQSQEDSRTVQREMRRMRLALESFAAQQQDTSQTLAGLLADQPPVKAIMDYAEAALLHSCARAAASAPSTAESILDARLHELLSAFGLAAICQAPVPFDPALHEVCDTVMQEQHPDATVLSIVRPGFILHGSVVQTALVVMNRRSHV